MAFPGQFLDELAARTDIVGLVGKYVSLVKRGNRFFGRCPFHSEKTASFSVLPERDMFYCFGCHAGGGAVQFMMKAENLSYPEAVRMLAKQAGIPVPEERDMPGMVRRDRLLEVSRLAARFFHNNLSKPEGEKAAAYLQNRGITPKAARRFGLGAAGDDRDGLIRHLLDNGVTREELTQAGLAARNDKGLMYDAFRKRAIFPIFDPGGSVVAFSGRNLEDTGSNKYKNSAESSLYSKRRTLYALNFAKASPNPYFILAEGNIDVVTLHQNGFDSAVATCGTALTQEQAKLMARYKQHVVLAYDGDAAGIAATQKAIPKLDAVGLKVRVLRLPQGADPDDLIRQFGKAAFENLLNGAEGHMDYRFRLLESQHDLKSDPGRIDFLRQASAMLASIPSEAERGVWSGRAAEAAGVTRQAVQADVERAIRLRLKKEQHAEKMALVYPREAIDTAQEWLLAILLNSPEFTEKLNGRIGPDDFGDPTLSGVFTCIATGMRTDDPSLPPEQAALVAKLLATDIDVSQRAFEDCISRVQEQSALKKAISEGEDALMVKYRLQKVRKGYG